MYGDALKWTLSSSSSQVIVCFQKKHNSCLIFDPSYPKNDLFVFKENEDWESYYGRVK
jgi:hypothetical protein